MDAAAGDLAEAFPPAEFLVRVESTRPGAVECIVQWRPECVILEASLLELCRRVKADRVPVLVTAAERDQALINRSLKEGADDFLQKPCHPVELAWRVRGLLRRYDAPPPPAPVLKRGPLTLDPEQGLATLDGEDLGLTRKELLLLEVFLRSHGRVLTRRHLLEHIWGYDSEVRTRVVDLCVFQLRRKLGARWGRCLSTRRGYGYVLNLR